MSEAEGEVGLFPQSAGERLRAARVAAGLDLTDVATRTRVPLRHLEAIENSQHGGMPSSTYAIGFARSYARAVGADEKEIASALRVELGRAPSGEAAVTPYEPVDPARVPSRLLALTALGIAILLGLAYWGWRAQWFGGDAPVVGAQDPAAVVAPPAPATPGPVAAPTGKVVLTAIAPVWLRIYDQDRKRLFEKEMAVGETYSVPADATEPMILTGRPDALSVTVGGQPVAPLGVADRAIKDVGISATALAARAPTPSAPTLPQPTPLDPLIPPPAGREAPHL